MSKLKKGTLIIYFLLFHNWLLGNMSEPPREPLGQSSGELFIKENVCITEEKLNIDLKNVPKGGPAYVQAKYFLNCEKNIDSLELFFVAEKLDSRNFQIKLDGQAVKGTTDVITDLPANWQAPQSIKGFENMDLFYKLEMDSSVYDNENSPTTIHKNLGNIRFFVNLTKGEHNIEVTYQSNLTHNYSRDISNIYEFVYILSPAKEWKSFKNLTVQVQLPEKWEYVSNIDFSESNEGLKAELKQIEPDYLSLAIRYPPATAKMLVNTTSWILFLAGLGLSIFLLYKACVARVQQKLKKLGLIMTTLALPVLGIIGFLIVYIYTPDIYNWLLEGELSSHITHSWSYGIGILIVLFVPMAFIIYYIILLLLQELFLSKLKKAKV